MAIAAIKEGLLPVSMFGTVFHNRIGYHDYEGASLYLDERERIVSSLGPHKAMILRNHGLMAVGKTVPECFLRLYRLERACQVQLLEAEAHHLGLAQPRRQRVPLSTRGRRDRICGAHEKARQDRRQLPALKPEQFHVEGGGDGGNGQGEADRAAGVGKAPAGMIRPVMLAKIAR